MIVIVSVEFKQGCLWRQESFPVVKFMNCRYSVPKQGQRTCVSIIDNNLWCFCFYLVNKTCKSVQLLRFVLNWLWYAKAECKISGKRLGCYVTRPQLVPGLEEDQYTICELPCASVIKQALVQNTSYGEKYDLHELKPVGRTHIHMVSYGLLLMPRQKATCEQPISWWTSSSQE